MPKNTYFIKENYKKVEEIREVENQIPSYEEFLNNYNQGQVNYDDLIHQDISSNKGYGPCSWNNPDCKCYLSQGFVLLRTSCPTGNCRSTITSNWFHSNSGHLLASSQTGCGTLVISNNARIKCASCGIEGNWREWQFSCSSHLGSYNQVDAESFIDALSITMRSEISSSSNRKHIISGLIQTLMNDC